MSWGLFPSSLSFSVELRWAQDKDSNVQKNKREKVSANFYFNLNNFLNKSQESFSDLRFLFIYRIGRFSGTPTRRGYFSGVWKIFSKTSRYLSLPCML